MAKSTAPVTVFTWTIAQLERSVSDGMIQTVHYQVAAKDDAYASSAYGSLGLEPADPESMVPYSELSPELCVQWVKDSFGPEKVAEIEGALQDQLDQQRAPRVAQGVPWTVEAA